jgi:hypothetical protein
LFVQDTGVATPPVPLTEHVLLGCTWPTHVDSQTVMSMQLVESSEGHVDIVLISVTAVHESTFGVPPLEYHVHVGLP